MQNQCSNQSTNLQSISSASAGSSQDVLGDDMTLLTDLLDKDIITERQVIKSFHNGRKFDKTIIKNNGDIVFKQRGLPTVVVHNNP